MKIFKSKSGKIGLGVLFCATCCALPLMGLLGSTAAVGASFFSGGPECLLIAFLALASIGFWMAWKRKTDASTCKTSCGLSCGCNSDPKAADSVHRIQA